MDVILLLLPEVNEEILPYFTTALLQSKDELFPHGSSKSYKLCKRKRAPTLINSFVESISTAQKTYLQQLEQKTEFVSNLAGAIHMDKLLADEDGSTEEYSSTDDSSISEEEKETLKDGSIRHRCPFTKC